MSTDTQLAGGPRNASTDTREHYQPDLDCIRAFTHYINNNLSSGLSVGHDGTNYPRKYMSYAKLRQYCLPSRIGGILNNGYNITIRRQTIEERYLRVFATLVWIDQVPWLAAFTEGQLEDGHFPCDSMPNCWPPAASYKKLWSEFSAVQWIFFPFTFDSHHLLNYRMSPSCILPVDSSTLIAEGDGVQVHLIEVHQGYSTLIKVCPSMFPLSVYRCVFPTGQADNWRTRTMGQPITINLYSKRTAAIAHKNCTLMRKKH